MSSRLPFIAPFGLPGTHLTKNANARRPAVPNYNRRTHALHEPCVPELVAARAASEPTAPALKARGKAMSYGELDDRANQLANYLIRLGVQSRGPNNLVAVCLDRSVTAVVCSLAILKAGGAYLPLDPTYPLERLAFMLSDARPRVLITRQEIAEQIPSGAWHVLAIDLADPEISRQSTHSPVCDISPEDLAYVIYTSGSTGQPKGVEITHASLMNLVSWHQQAFKVTSADRSSLLA